MEERRRDQIGVVRNLALSYVSMLIDRDSLDLLMSIPPCLSTSAHSVPYPIMYRVTHDPHFIVSDPPTHTHSCAPSHPFPHIHIVMIKGHLGPEIDIWL